MIRNENTKTAIATHEVKPLTREQIDMLAAGLNWKRKYIHHISNAVSFLLSPQERKRCELALHWIQAMIHLSTAFKAKAR